MNKERKPGLQYSSDVWANLPVDENGKKIRPMEQGKLFNNLSIKNIRELYEQKGEPIQCAHIEDAEARKFIEWIANNWHHLNKRAIEDMLGLMTGQIEQLITGRIFLSINQKYRILYFIHNTGQTLYKA